MSDKIRDAYVAYQDAQKLAEDNYEEFWQQTLASHGFVFQKKDYRNLLVIGDHEITFFIYPRKFEGVKFEFHDTKSVAWNAWRTVKVMSESGLMKVLRTLHNLKT